MHWGGGDKDAAETIGSRGHKDAKAMPREAKKGAKIDGLM